MSNRIFQEKLLFLIQVMAPAVFVHLWLPLFALGSFGVRVLYVIFQAVEWAQWFLKQGNRHPLWAIGVVAAALVFFGVAIGKAVI
jgi:hypothetical protein